MLLAMLTCDYAGHFTLPCWRLSGENSPVLLIARAPDKTTLLSSSSVLRRLVHQGRMSIPILSQCGATKDREVPQKHKNWASFWSRCDLALTYV